MLQKSPDPTDRHVGSRVRMRRLMLGVTQGELGDVLGLTFQQVQKYENGKNRIAASRLQLMSDYLQVPVMFFFEGAPPHGSAAGSRENAMLHDVSDFLSTSQGVALVKAFSQIKSTALRTCIVNVVEEIADARD
jgi:transcriptional regulator with XRE-family HTH domain